MIKVIWTDGSEIEISKGDDYEFGDDRIDIEDDEGDIFMSINFNEVKSIEKS